MPEAGTDGRGGRKSDIDGPLGAFNNYADII